MGFAKQYFRFHSERCRHGRECHHPKRHNHRKELMEKVSLKGWANFEKLYLAPALEAERTTPDKPNSRLQQCRLTDKAKDTPWS